MLDAQDPVRSLIARADRLCSREVALREVLMDLVEHIQVVVDRGSEIELAGTDVPALLVEAEQNLDSDDRTAALVLCERAEARVRGLRVRVEPGWN